MIRIKFDKLKQMAKSCAIRTPLGYMMHQGRFYMILDSIAHQAKLNQDYMVRLNRDENSFDLYNLDELNKTEEKQNDKSK